MKYNHDYYIMALSLPVDAKSRHAKKVKGSDLFTVWTASNDLRIMPEMFIYKSDLNDYVLTDLKTGMCIYSNKKLKNVMSWMDDPHNIERLLTAYNRKEFIEKQTAIFNQLVKEAQQ